MEEPREVGNGEREGGGRGLGVGVGVGGGRELYTQEPMRMMLERRWSCGSKERVR